mmetsp:Transcript_7239/g.10226  ORF Transcript_7239/g.10226 Transcript_7239/m.10226 type:complete len:389 (-) Transcript_7239:563-1729(-)
MSTLLFIRFKSSTISSTLLFSSIALSSASRSSLAQIMAVTVSRRALSSIITLSEAEEGSVSTSGISQHSSGFPKHNFILSMTRSLSSNNASLATSSVSSFPNCSALSLALTVGSAETAQSGRVSGVSGGGINGSSFLLSLPSNRFCFSSAALIDRCVSTAAASIKFRTPSVRYPGLLVSVFNSCFISQAVSTRLPAARPSLGEKPSFCLFRTVDFFLWYARCCRSFKLACPAGATLRNPRFAMEGFELTLKLPKIPPTPPSSSLLSKLPIVRLLVLGSAFPDKMSRIDRVTDLISSMGVFNSSYKLSSPSSSRRFASSASCSLNTACISSKELEFDNCLAARRTARPTAAPDVPLAGNARATSFTARSHAKIPTDANNLASRSTRLET